MAYKRKTIMPIKITPRWIKAKRKKVEELVVKLAKEGHNSAKIGSILRDKHKIPDVKAITGKSVTKIMKENKVYPELPEDMLNLLRKAVSLRAHLEKHKADKHSKRGLEILESRIRRLGKYYSRREILPKNWSYDPKEAKLIVQK